MEVELPHLLKKGPYQDCRFDKHRTIRELREEFVMKKTLWRRIIAIVLVFVLTGCGSTSGESAKSQSSQTDISEGKEIVEKSGEVEENVTNSGSLDESSSETDSSSIEKTTINESSSAEGSSAVETTAPESSNEAAVNTLESSDEEKTNEYGLSEQQMNSFSMLYYLAIAAEEIRTEKDNRLVLEDIYTSLLNDINPGAIDDTTQDHLKNLRDVIGSYVNIAVKRERIQYIYNQDKAAAIRSAVPNPLAVLSMTKSLDWKKFALNAVYTIVDSYTKYKNSSDAADKEFLMSGWELDDEERETVKKNRDNAFDYMVDIVQKYVLPGKLTLNEDAIVNFAEICDIESNREKIRRLQAEYKTYKLLGNYWLELASCYFEADEFENCLDCVEEYNKLAIGIYRKDSNYVQILPKAIVAAQKTYSGDMYITKTKAFADDIIENTSTDEWSVRYFAAQVYLDLYARTKDMEYLDKAYNIAYDNVTILLKGQRTINSAFLADVKPVEVKEPDYRYMDEKQKKAAEKEYKAEKKRAKKYNKVLEEARKTELPALYEPLVLNCELLFALANEKDISSSEKKEIEEILQTDKNGIFLSDIANNKFSFSGSIDKYDVKLNKDEIIIPSCALMDGAIVSATITDGGSTTVLDDFVIKQVKREGKTIDTFSATYTSKKMKSYKWTADSKITISIRYGENYDPLSFDFIVSEYSDKGLLPDKVVFKQK